MLPGDYQNNLESPRQKSTKPGRMWARASLVCAAWSLFLAPGIFGPLGIALGMVAVWKGVTGGEL